MTHALADSHLMRRHLGDARALQKGQTAWSSGIAVLPTS